MTPKKLKWLAFELGLLFVSLVVFLNRAITAVDFNITYDGYALALVTFAIGMLVREVFV